MLDVFEFAENETNLRRNSTVSSSSEIKPRSNSFHSGSASSKASPPRSNHNYRENFRNGFDNNNSNSSSFPRRGGFYNQGSRPNTDRNYQIRNEFRKTFNPTQHHPNNTFRHHAQGFRRPFQTQIRSSFTKDYKSEATRQLPKFEIKSGKSLGVKRTVYHRNLSMKFTKPLQIEEIERKPIDDSISFLSPDSLRTSPSGDELSSGTCTPSNSPAYSNEPMRESFDEPSDDPMCDSCPYFRIKTIKSYREFCKIKLKSSITLESPSEAISFLKALLPTPDQPQTKQPIFLFFDRVDRVFYGAAAVCMKEISRMEHVDTGSLESLILRLNWIYLSEVEESDVKFNSNELQESTEMDPVKCSQLLQLMEQSETQLHDLKKLKPEAMKLKSSRLEELEEFFKLSEGHGRSFEGEYLVDLNVDISEPVNVSESVIVSESVNVSEPVSVSEPVIVSESTSVTDLVDSFTILQPVSTQITECPVVNNTEEESGDSEYDFFGDYE